MSGDKIKMSYSQNQLRVRVTFLASYCLETPQPPEAVIRKASSKLSNEQALGTLDLVEVNDSKMHELWRRVRQDMQQPGARDLRITFTVACGAPRINEIHLDHPDSPKTAFYLTFKGSPAFANNWPFDFVRINIEHRLKQMGLDVKANYAQVFSCWLRARRGEPIVNRPISVLPTIEDGTRDRGFSIASNKTRSEVSVNIYDAAVFKDPARMQGLVSQCAKSVAKLQASTGTPIEFLKDRLIDRLKSSLRGAERYGMDLPATYLVGYPAVAQINLQTASTMSGFHAAAPTPSLSYETTKTIIETPHYAGKGLLKIRVHEGAMKATIENFDKGIYDHPDFDLDVDWVEREVKTAGIKFGFNENIRANLEAVIGAGGSLEGQVVALGEAPIDPKRPYLSESYKQARTIEQVAEIDMRELQQRSLVHAGEMVAEVCYEIEARPGRNVYGQPAQPSKGEPLQLAMGEGVELRSDGNYYATYDGVPEVTGSSIALSKVLVHQGDVNLRTGNIRFDGPVEIKGAIDSGATVEVTGDLIVHGTIRDANVRVGGSLDARSGIITGKRGLIRVRNDVLAQFMENARVICGGNVIIKKVLINSNVVAGGSIEANSNSGVIAGGRISCRKFIRTAKLGFPKGAGTHVFAGVDWRAKVAVEIREDRLERVIEANTNDRNSLRELTRRKQKTKKQVEKIQELQNRLQKARLLLDKLKDHLNKAKSEMTYDPDARVFVHDTLFANVSVEVAGIAIPVTHDVAEVELSPKRLRGTNIHPLIDESGNPKKVG